MNEPSMNSNSKFSSSDYTIQIDHEEEDPALQPYYRISIDMAIPVEIRTQRHGKTLNDPGTLEMLRLRVMTATEGNHPEVKLELTSEDDLFFNYVSLLDTKSFGKVKKEQNLTIGFESFVQMVSKLSTLLHTEKENHFAIMYLHRNNTGHLDFNENVEYRFIEVLSLDFAQVDQELNKQLVSFRFNAVKRKLHMLTHNVKEVSNLLKIKNPSLLQKLGKKKGE